MASKVAFAPLPLSSALNVENASFGGHCCLSYSTALLVFHSPRIHMSRSSKSSGMTKDSTAAQEELQSRSPKVIPGMEAATVLGS